MQTHVRTLLNDGLSTCTHRIGLDARNLHERANNVSETPSQSEIFRRVAEVYCEGEKDRNAHELNLFSVLSRSFIDYKSMPRYSRNLVTHFCIFDRLHYHVRLQTALKATISGRNTEPISY